MGIYQNPSLNKETGIDKAMQPLIGLLNNHGIKTKSCCCGHGKRKAYISLDMKGLDVVITNNTVSIYWDFKKRGDND